MLALIFAYILLLWKESIDKHKCKVGGINKFLQELNKLFLNTTVQVGGIVKFVRVLFFIPSIIQINVMMNDIHSDVAIKTFMTTENIREYNYSEW